MVSETLEIDVSVVFSVSPRWQRGVAALTFQIILSFEPRSDLLDHFATFGVVFCSFLQNCYLPTVAIRLNGDRHIGRPIADVLHFYLDRGFEFGGCFARLFHDAEVAALEGTKQLWHHCNYLRAHTGGSR
jgi:hypothetical protein